MRSNSILGVIGGILIVVAVFLTGSTITFSGDAITETVPLILFIAGLAVIAFSLMGNRLATGYASMVAGTIALIWLVTLLRSDNIEVSVKLIVLLIGVVLAFVSSFGRSRV